MNDWKNESEAQRLHWDWFGECRTCKWWTGIRTSWPQGSRPRESFRAKCSNNASDGFDEEVSCDGDCPEWDSYDVDAALYVLEEDEKLKKQV